MGGTVDIKSVSGDLIETVDYIIKKLYKKHT